jgi:TonB family protein
MSEVWQQCEGQVIENTGRLQQYLGGTEDSAVFLTQLAGSPSQKAAIKFIPAGTSADLQLSLWRRAMQLAHPNLLRIFAVGRCRLSNRDRLFVVMEHAEEDLSQILPQRPLTASEAREMLEPVLDVLVYLHGNGLVHSRIKPSNILATADQLKLSSDTFFPIGESRKSSRKLDAHDAPETAASPLSAAADVWSLGMTLVETLTQHGLRLAPGSESDPIVPDTLPQPFLDIARHALRREPRRRWTIREIAVCLNPVAVGAAAGQSVSPLAVPLSSVPAVPAAKLQAPQFDAPSPKVQAQPPRSQAANRPGQTLVLPNYVVPVAAALLVIVAIFALPKILGHRPDSSSSASTASAPPPAQPKPIEPPARGETTSAPKPSATSATHNSLKAAAEKRPAAQPPSSPVAAAAPAAVHTGTFPSANAPSASASSSARGEVLEQILPEVSEKARATIHGVVRVGVRVHVDPTGNVSEASLDSAGPSKYFADLALKAARRWQFASPELGGHSVPSEWLIRFQFSSSGPKAFPMQTTP